MARKSKKSKVARKKAPVHRAAQRRDGDKVLGPAAAQKAASAPLRRSSRSKAMRRWYRDPLDQPNEYKTVRDAIEGQAQRFGGKTFLIYEEDGSTYSYAGLDVETSRNVNLFRMLGAKTGARIGILDANTPDFVFLYMGCMKGGYTSAPLNYHLKAPELLFCLENSESDLLFVAGEFWPEVAKILPQLGFLRAIVLIGDRPAGYEGPVRATAREFAEVARRRPPGDDRRMVDCHGLRKSLPAKIPPAHPRPKSESEGEIIYTSGTTGKPKGVILRHHQFMTDAKYIARWYRMKAGDMPASGEETGPAGKWPGETRMMMILPLFHVNAEVVTTMTPLVYGGSVVMFRKFSASRFWPAIEKYQVNIFSTVPTILSILNGREREHLGGRAREMGARHEAPLPTTLARFAPADAPLPAQPPKRRVKPRDLGLAAAHDISSLACCICGAAPLPAEVQLEWERTFLVPVIEGYGLSETTCYSTFNPVEGWRKVATIGVEVGNEIAIFGARNREMPANDMGEIVIRGENVMREYFKRPEANAEAFSGGWFHSGDVGEKDEDGFIRIRDRVKDMIIRGGENIYPREIDEVLYTHPAIENAATIGVPDAKYGEEVSSFVVLKGGRIPAPDEARRLETDIVAYCRERLADYKVPRRVIFIAEIPKGPTGKLLRRVLREMVPGK